MPSAYLKPAYILLSVTHSLPCQAHHSSESCRACCQCIHAHLQYTYVSAWTSWNVKILYALIWNLRLVVGRNIDTHTHAQCSHNSVGLTQARPNKNSLKVISTLKCTYLTKCWDTNHTQVLVFYSAVNSCYISMQVSAWASLDTTSNSNWTFIARVFR